MAFMAKEIESKSGIDCLDFDPMFFDRRHCKKSGKCDYKEQDFIDEGHAGIGGYCTGIKWDESSPISRKLPKADPRLVNK